MTRGFSFLAQIRNALHISWVTAREILGEKVLYNVFLVSIFMMGITWLASKLGSMTQIRTALDFGLTSVWLSCGVLSLLVGSSLVNREFERRTVALIFSKPIPRFVFVGGKLWGLSWVLLLNWALMCLLYALILLGLEIPWSGTLTAGVLLLLGQSILLGAVAVFFSTFSTTSLSVILSAGVYMVGANLPSIRLVMEKSGNSLAGGLSVALGWLVPQFSIFHLGEKVPYGLPVEASYVMGSLLYALGFSFLLVLLGGHLVDRKGM